MTQTMRRRGQEQWRDGFPSTPSQSLRDSQARTARTHVGNVDLRRVRRNGFADELAALVGTASGCRVRPRYCSGSDDCSRMKRLTIRSSSEWKLMTHKTSRPCVSTSIELSSKPPTQLLELVVDENANRLERLRCRDVSACVTRAHASLMICQLRRASIGCSDRVRRRSRSRSLAAYALRQILSARVSKSFHPLCASHSAALTPVLRVHSHVERSVAQKAEAALASSSCGDETPRSRSRPSTFP